MSIVNKNHKNCVHRLKTGDIHVEYDKFYYEYDVVTDRCYFLDDGTTVNSPDGKLAKRRISKKLFNEIIQNIEKEGAKR